MKIYKTMNFEPIVEKNVEKRDIFSLIPGYSQTETLDKFFSATLNNLFSSGSVVGLSGYIGSKPTWYKPGSDNYLDESRYQLEPSSVSINSETNELISMMDYQEFLNYLSSNGVNVSEPNRLFSQDSYSWCPPIDLDKIINFRQYYWMTDTTNTVKLLGPSINHITQLNQDTFDLPSTNSSGILLTRWDRNIDTRLHILINGTNYSEQGYSYVIINNTVTITPAPPQYSEIVIYIPCDIELWQNEVVIPEQAFNIKLESNMRVDLSFDINTNLSFAIVENMGTGMKLVPDLTGTIYPDYITIARTSADRNIWSRKNNWIHVSQLNSNSAIQANRPIVEFIENMKLYNYGTSRIPDIDFMVDNISSIMNDIDGMPSKNIDGKVISISSDGTSLEIDGNVVPEIRFLVTSDTDAVYNNRIYRLLIENNLLKVDLQALGIDPSGVPLIGEIVFIKNGNQYAGSEFHWNGINWVRAQVKGANLYPLFDLKDTEGNFLSNSFVYPNNNFSGSRIFGYAVNDFSPIDTVLGLRLSYDNKGQIMFYDYLSNERYMNNDIEITGRYFWYNYVDEYSKSNWHITNETNQILIDRFESDGSMKIFTISQSFDKIESMTVNRIRTDNNGQIEKIALQEIFDFARVSTNKLMITSVLPNDVFEVEIKTVYSPINGSSGVFSIPLNLSSNSANQEVSSISQGDMYDHFNLIISKQDNFTGQEFSSNNWKDTLKDLSKSGKIFQHTAPMLKAMILSSSENLEIVRIIDFVNREYRNFLNRYDQTANLLYSRGDLRETDSLEVWFNQILKTINKGKTSIQPFYGSDMAGGLFWIPATPSWLGITPLFYPEKTTQYILGHDGSKTALLGDKRDDARLYLERRIYESVKPNILQNSFPINDIRPKISGIFRVGNFSYEESLSLLQPIFERWTSYVGNDYRTNRSFDPDNILTWNWKNVEEHQHIYEWDSNIFYVAGMKISRLGKYYVAKTTHTSTLWDDNYWSLIEKPVPRILRGNARAIYHRFYDTITPHLTPWEMLGFTIKPSWWDATYGTAPYTSGNAAMWLDLEQGIISGEMRMDKNYARPGLRYMIPVNDQGVLLNPFECNLVKNYPTIVNARSDWEFGDWSPSETAWRTGSEFPFAISILTFLFNPNKMVEYSWDTENFDSSTLLTINGETPTLRSKVHYEFDDGIQIKKVGIQQWVSDYLFSKGLSVTTFFGDVLRGTQSKLSYKIQGFVDSRNLQIISETSGLIPNENWSVALVENKNTKISKYSGVMVEWNGTTWQVYGFDPLEPAFNIFMVDPRGRKKVISTGTEPVKTVITWKPNTYYSQGTIVRFQDKYYQSLRSHTSSQNFETNYWMEVSRPIYEDTQKITWYEDYVDTDIHVVPYGSEFQTLQDLSDFLAGYQMYLINDGWIFDHMVENANTGISYISDFSSSMAEILNWSLNAINSGEFIAVSPAYESAKYQTSFGRINSVESTTAGYYSLIDQTMKPIDPRTTTIYRKDQTIQIDSPVSQLFGIRISQSNIEHVVILDNRTIFGDIIYDPLLNTKQERLTLRGVKTANWNGNLNADGYLISNSNLIPNFENTADSFRDMFEIEKIDFTGKQERARSNIGYQKKEYMDNLLVGDINQFEFYQGMIQQKGTKSGLSKILRSEYISSNRPVNLNEEWLIRKGQFGACETSRFISINLRQSDIVNDPHPITFSSFTIDTTYPDVVYEAMVGSLNSVIFTLPENLYINKLTVEILENFSGTTPQLDIGTDTNNKLLAKNIKLIEDKIVIKYKDQLFPSGTIIKAFYRDLLGSDGMIRITLSISRPLILPSDTSSDVEDYFNSSGEILVRDSKWYEYDFGGPIIWNTTLMDNIDNVMPTAGHVCIDEVSYFAPTRTDMINLQQVLSVNNSDIELNNSISFTFIPNMISNHSILLNALPSGKGKKYRVKTFVINISKAFIPGSIDISLKLDNTTFLPINLSEDVVGEHTFNLYDIRDNQGQDIKIQITQNISSPVSIGEMQMSITGDILNTGLCPDNRLWVYDTGNGDWMTYVLEDTNHKIDTIYPSSRDGQGSVVALDNLFKPINLFNRELLINGLTDSDIKLDQILVGKTSGVIQKVITANSDEIDLLQTLYSKSGVRINRISYNVLQPFLSGSQLTIGLGNNNEYFVEEYDPSSLNDFNSSAVDSKPSFDDDLPITVSIYDTFIQYQSSTPANNRKVEVTRSGSVFVKPVSFQIGPSGNPGGSGYTIPPTVIVNGIKNVQGVANVSGGKVTSIDLITGTSCRLTGPVNPSVELIGGDGTGATAELIIQPSDVSTEYTTTITWKCKNLRTGQDIVLPPTVFLPPNDPSLSNTDAYWLQSIDLSGSDFDAVSEDTDFEISIDTVTPATVLVDSSISIVRVLGTAEQRRWINLTTINQGSFDTSALSITDGNMNSYLSTEGATGTIILTIDYEYDNGFEIYNVDGSVATTSSEAHGANIWLWNETRFNTTPPASNPSGFNNWKLGTIVEVTPLNDKWLTYKYNGNWNNSLLRRQPMVVDQGKIISGEIKDVHTNELKQNSQIWDPRKGYIPGFIDREITYKLNVDPAQFSNQGEKSYWSDDHIGEIWLDLSSIKYLEYEIDLSLGNTNDEILATKNYRIKNWGKLLPGLTPKVYEWIESIESPTDYSGPGIPKYTDRWTEKQVWDKINHKVVNRYYFWVEGSNLIPKGRNRKISALQISNSLSNPQNQNLPAIAVIGSHLDSNPQTVLVFGSKNFVKEDGTVATLKWSTNNGNE